MTAAGIDGVLAGYGFLAAGIWSWRCAAGLRALRRAPRLSTSRPPPAGSPLVSILVPARNEEKNIAACLESLLAQDYPRFEVIAVDDNSTDRTGETMRELAARDQRLAPISAPPTPPGWTGKNAALAAGAGRARGEWLLFTDADTRHGPHALSSALAHAEARGLAFLSLVPRAIPGNLLERVLQPPALGYLGKWFPLTRVNDPSDPLAFANGQFLLIRRAAYDALGGHSAVRGAYLEDVALARAAKEKGLRFEFALGKRHLGVRMYDSIPRYFRGWRRIYLHAFDRRPLVLLGKAADLAALSILPLPFLVYAARRVLAEEPAGHTLQAAAAAGALAVALLYLFAAKVQSGLGERRIYAIFHPLAAAVLTVVLLAAAHAAFTRAPTRWR